ncbi:hypothetical protein ABT115_11025 [Streptomyces sp. NPDC001832]|uniref:hypothetical protein n=1 Tax=Streptomyces sp. NPDC001832 TaxID=3154527 RepID=UPI00332D5CE5
MLPSSTAVGWRERASVLVHLAAAIVLGAANLSEVEQLQLHHRPLFGSAASDSTARRTLAALDEAVLAKIAKARARVGGTCGVCCICGFRSTGLDDLRDGS